jgi:hypothetical protein
MKIELGKCISYSVFRQIHNSIRDSTIDSVKRKI